MMLSFRKPTLPSRDDYVFDVLSVLLGEGNTSRLNKRLVFKDRLAQAIGVFGAPGSRLENLFVVAAIPLAGVTNAKIEAAIFDELERLKREPVSPQELEKVRNRVAADHARSLDTNSGLASRLSYFQAVAGDWRYTADHPKVIESITAEDVMRVAKTYFTPENLTVVELARPSATLGGAK
jgi:predicted Zn-dependent peptidase